MFDKILLGALPLLLPITIVLTNFYANKSQQPTVNEENLAKVNQMLDQLQQSIKEKPTQTITPQIDITAVYYASESGELIISGIAPKTDLSLQVSIIEKKKLASIPKQSSDSAVLGDAIDVKALPASLDGLFKYAYEVDKPKDLDKVEIRFEQGPVSKTVLYNFEKASFEQF